MNVYTSVVCLFVLSVQLGSSLENDVIFWADAPSTTVIIVSWIQQRDVETNAYVRDYIIAYKPTGGTDGPTVIYTTTKTNRMRQSLSIKGLKLGTSYDYAVVAGSTNVQAEGFQWPWDNITTKAYMETTFQLSSQAPTSITVNWQYRNSTLGERPNFFEIPYMTAANSNGLRCALILNISWNEYTITDLLPDTNYKVTVLSDFESKNFYYGTIDDYPWKTVRTLQRF